MSKIDKELIRQARQTNLALFLTARGEKLKKNGRRYRHLEHDSLVFTDNMFYWNSRQAKGNALDFMMLFYDLDFRTAIEMLTETDLRMFDIVNEEKKLIIKEDDDTKRVVAYLCQTRKINYKIVKDLIEKKLVVQDERGNAIFKIYDENLELVGAELVGTLSDVRFKGIVDGTKLGYGFNFVIGKPLKTLFFESPIDLMSFLTIHYNDVKNHRLVSLAGLRVDIFENIVKVFGIAEETAFLCVDNNLAGFKFINGIKKVYPEIKTFLPKLDDWNEIINQTNEKSSR